MRIRHFIVAVRRHARHLAAACTHTVRLTVKDGRGTPTPSRDHLRGAT